MVGHTRLEEGPNERVPCFRHMQLRRPRSNVAANQSGDHLVSLLRQILEWRSKWRSKEWNGLSSEQKGITHHLDDDWVTWDFSRGEYSITTYHSLHRSVY